MRKNELELCSGKIWGIPVSEYALEHGYLDYATLAQMLQHYIPNNKLRDMEIDDRGIVNGSDTNIVFQDYIISESGAKILQEYTDELVFYNWIFDIYIWAVDHTGTSWDYTLTDVKLVGNGDEE